MCLSASCGAFLYDTNETFYHIKNPGTKNVPGRIIYYPRYHPHFRNLLLSNGIFCHSIPDVSFLLFHLTRVTKLPTTISTVQLWSVPLTNSLYVLSVAGYIFLSGSMIRSLLLCLCMIYLVICILS